MGFYNAEQLLAHIPDSLGICRTYERDIKPCLALQGYGYQRTDKRAIRQSRKSSIQIAVVRNLQFHCSPPRPQPRGSKITVTLPALLNSVLSIKTLHASHESSGTGA